MSFHMEAFSSSIAVSGANQFQQLSYVAVRNIIPLLNLGLNIPAQLPFLHSVHGVGAHLVHVRPQTPAFLPYPYWSLSPNNRGTTFESPPRSWDFSHTPIAMKPTDELDFFVSQNAGAAEVEYVFTNLSDGAPKAPAAGKTFTVHGVGATTLVAGTWTQVPLTWDQTIPAGRYEVVGARALSASGLAFRLVPTEPPNYRPGGVCVQAYDQIDAQAQRFYNYLGGPNMPNWGVWIYTNSYVMPQVEFFAVAADTAEEVWLDMVLTGPAATFGPTTQI